MHEQYLIRFLDGNDAGPVVVDSMQFPAPLPGIIRGSSPGGWYEKVDEDQMPSLIPDGPPTRFATYRWRPEGKVG